MAARNGLERWRGSVDESLKNMEAGIARIESAVHESGERFAAALREHQEDDDKRHTSFNHALMEIEGRWTTLKTKIAVISAGAGIIAAVLADVAVRRVLGG